MTAISDMQWLMGDVRGRRFVYRLLEQAGIYRLTHTGEAISSAFNEGMRSAGLRLMNELLQHCPKRLFEMQRENLKHDRHDSSTSASSSPGTSNGTSSEPSAPGA